MKESESVRLPASWPETLPVVTCAVADSCITATRNRAVTVLFGKHSLQRRAFCCLIARGLESQQLHYSCILHCCQLHQYLAITTAAPHHTVSSFSSLCSFIFLFFWNPFSAFQIGVVASWLPVRYLCSGFAA